MPDLDIKEIRVFDPEVTYAQLCTRPDRMNYHLELLEQVSQSDIGNGRTLEDFLCDKETGYFRRNNVELVIFLKGKFHSEYSNSRPISEKQLDQIAKDTNAIPFIYHAPIELDEY